MEIISYAILLVCLVLQASAAAPTHAVADWVRVLGEKGTICSSDNLKPKGSNGKLCGISGMAWMEPKNGKTRFLVVHDNTPGLGIVTAGLTGPEPMNYHKLNLKTNETLKTDWEALASVPGEHWKFLALSKEGEVYYLTVSEDSAIVDFHFSLPKIQPQKEIEGLSVQRFGDQVVIVWGYRGAGKQPGIFYHGLLDLEKRKVTESAEPPVKVIQKLLLPDDDDTRHIADLKVDTNGVVWASATNDPGDNRQYVSVVYILGVLDASSNPVKFRASPNPTRLWTFNRKVEAIEIVPGADGGIAFGAEDEDWGGWLYFK